MKDWKKAVLWVLVGYCIISVAAGIFGIISFVQMAELHISNLGMSDAARTIFADNSAWALALSIVCVVLIAIAIALSAKCKNAKYTIPIIAILIAIFAISLFFVIYSYCTLPALEDATSNRNAKDTTFAYTTFVHYQTYLSAMLSTFLPLLIADGLILAYIIYTTVQQKRGRAEPTNSELQ